MKWLKRIVVVALIVVGLVLLVLAVPAGRYVMLAVEDDSFASAEQARLRAPPKAVVERVVVDGGARCLEGVVVQNGAPVAGAAVSAAPSRLDLGAACGCDRGCECSAAIEATFSDEARIAPVLVDAVGTTSDAQGHFALCQLPTGNLSVWAEGAASSSAQTDVEWPTSRSVRLTLTDTVPLVGRVVSRNKQTNLENAEVLIISSSGSPSVHTRTNAKGEFSATVPNVRLAVLVRATGYVPQRLWTLPDGLPLLVQLDRALDAFITVVDGAKPVVGARVSASNLSQTLTTDEHGLAHFKGINVEGETFVARAGTRLGKVRVSPTPTQTELRVTIELKAGFAVRGTVLRGTTPAADAPVRLSGESHVPLLHTDARGAFQTEALEPGSYDVKAYDEPCSVSVPVRLVDRDVEVTLTLQCADGLRGRVVTRQGAPLAGATVDATCGSNDEATETDADSYFNLSVPPGLCSVRVKDSRVSAFSQRVTAPKRDVVLVVDEGASVRGHVSDESGRPVRGAKVIIVNALLTQAMVEATREDRGQRTDAQTDDQGDFAIGGLAAGRYVCAVATFSDARQLLGFAPQFILNPEEHYDVGTIVVRADEALTGTVTDERGEPIAGASVTAEVEAQLATGLAAFSQAALGNYEAAAHAFPLPAETDALGHFVLPNARGVESVKARARGFTEQIVDIGNRRTLDIRMVRNGEVLVRGRVVDPKHAPVPAFRVEGHSFSSGDGLFEVTVEQLATKSSDRNNIDIIAPKFRPKSVAFRVNGDGRVPVDLGDVELEPIVTTVTVVRVRAEDGSPIRGAAVRVVPMEKAQAAHDVSDVDGLARVERRSAGGATIEVSARGYVPQSRPAAEGDEEQRFTLTPAQRRVEGHAFKLDGTPAGGSTVQLGDVRAVVDDDGHFVLEHVQPMATQLNLATPELEWGRVIDVSATNVEIGQVAGGGTVDLTLLSPGALLLKRGTWEAEEGRELFADSERVGDYLVSPVMAPGAHRLTGLQPGKWSVYFLSFSERGITALFKSLHLPPTVIDVGVGQSARVSYE